MPATRAAVAWPIAIVVVLAATVAGNIVVYVLAGRGTGDLVEPDYYARAVAWDSTQADRAASAALGWRADASLARATGGGAAFRLRLWDRAGRPVPGATVSVEGIHNLDPLRRVRGTFVTGPDGTARAHLPFDRAGLWELRVTARRGAARFFDDLRVECRPS
jgi:nitrogen fixation protein FixH